MTKGLVFCCTLTASILAATGSLAQDRLPRAGIPVSSECGKIAANSTLGQIRSRADLQASDSNEIRQQLADFANVLSRDPRFIDSLRCFQDLSAPSGR